MNERLKELREALGLSQDEFGKRIGSARNTIANYELGRRTPSNTIIKAICKEFRVNYYWLVNGDGDMLIGTPQDTIDDIAEEYDLNDIDKKIIQKFLELDKEQRNVITDYLRSIFT